MKRNRVMVVLMGAMALLLVLTGCRPKQATDDGKITVVSSLNFYGEVASAVLGDYGTVTSIITDPNVDPHDFEPTTATGKTVAQADYAIVNGGGYDAWLDKLVAAGNETKLISVAKLTGLKDGGNEHLWYKQTTMPTLANALAAEFAKRDPAHKKAYAANAKAYIAKLKPVTTLVNQLRAGADGQAVAESEPVFGNALADLGYTVSNQHFANAIEEGSDPSAADIRQLEAAIRDKTIAFFVQNTQVESKIITNIVTKVKKAGIPVLKITETMPKGETYVSWMLRQYKQLEQIQTKSK